MHPPLAFLFLQRTGGETTTTNRAWVEASDLFVLFTLGTFLFLLVCFGVCAWMIWRRTTRPEPHVQLLMELANEGDPPAEAQRAAAGDATETPLAPWEKPEDWWKKGID